MADPQRILVVQPSWVGDAVMATPTLRAIRQLYPDAHIAYLLRRYVRGIYAGLPWADQLITYRTDKTRGRTGKGAFDLAGRVRAGRFDLAVLLTNSFKTALVCKMAGIPRVFGYERDGRGFLLTDRLLPAKHRGRFVPTPIIHTYLALARYLGADGRDLRMELAVTYADRRDGAAVLSRCGVDVEIDRPGSRGGPPLVILNPGAQYGAAKLWTAEGFATLADRFTTEMRATVLLSATPKERAIVERIRSHMRGPAVDLSTAGMTLGGLKDVVRRCDLMVTNDTGPRHVAAALGVPVVTVFGPTHPEWTDIYYAAERQVSVPVFCGPCQKKVCPLDHRCMTGVTAGMVWEAAMQLLLPGRRAEVPVGRRVPLAVVSS